MLKKGNIFNLETISPFFYFKNVHAYLRDAKRNMVREFNAYIANVDVSSFSNGEEDFVNITFMAYPLPWFMQETNNYLVYVNKTTQDIIKDVFTDFCKNSFITEPYSPVFVVKPKKTTLRTNCVQNGESNWDFILRLLDEEDWNYTFVHKDKKCEFHIFDNIETPKMLIPKSGEKLLNLDLLDDYSLVNTSTNDQMIMKKEYLTNLGYQNNGATQPVDAIESDFRQHAKLIKKDETKPKVTPIRPSPVKLKWTCGFEGGKKYAEAGDTNKNTNEKAEKLEAKYSVNYYLAFGKTNSLKAYLGSTINAKYSLDAKKLQSTTIKNLTNYRVQNLSFSFFMSPFIHDKTCLFYTDLILHPADTQYGIEQEYIRNFIDGTTHGKVVADDKKIYLDEKFYIKIALPWQYDGMPVKSKFIYARYMSPWASQNYGMFVTPRHDDEVLIAFENGDPDLPIVLGSLYNPKKKYPVDFKSKKHVLTIYDQPSENKKNNFFEMDHKKATVNIAAAEHMKIRSFGDHLTQSKLKMEMITYKNMLSKSKEEMEFKTEKNMLHEAKEQMELTTDKFYCLTAKEQIELLSEKHFLLSTKEASEIVAEKFITLIADENIEFKTKKNLLQNAKENIEITADKVLNLKSYEELNIVANQKLTINVGSVKITIEESGNVSIDAKEIKLKGATKSIVIK
jgi:type VI secretion system secreted protein VgrG